MLLFAGLILIAFAAAPSEAEPHSQAEMYREQREKLLADLQQAGSEHGMTTGEIEAVMTLFPATQPEAR